MLLDSVLHHGFVVEQFILSLGDLNGEEHHEVIGADELFINELGTAS
jgi:hypothetical protein